MPENDLRVGDDRKLYVRSKSFFMISYSGLCWKCGGLTCVSVIGMPPGYECREDRKAPWVAGGDHGPGFLSYIKRTTKDVYDKIKEHNISHYHDHSNVAGFRYHMNHCQKCKNRIGDNYVFYDQEYSVDVRLGNIIKREFVPQELTATVFETMGATPNGPLRIFVDRFLKEAGA